MSPEQESLSGNTRKRTQLVCRRRKYRKSTKECQSPMQHHQENDDPSAPAQESRAIVACSEKTLQQSPVAYECGASRRGGPLPDSPTKPARTGPIACPLGVFSVNACPVCNFSLEPALARPRRPNMECWPPRARVFAARRASNNHATNPGHHPPPRTSLPG